MQVMGEEDNLRARELMRRRIVALLHKTGCTDEFYKDIEGDSVFVALTELDEIIKIITTRKNQ